VSNQGIMTASINLPSLILQSEEDHANPPSTVMLRASKRASQEANLFLQHRNRARPGKVAALRS
jgi:hypothetical protein